MIAPSIEGCIAWMKCTLDREVTDEEKYPTINGKVVHLEIDDRYLIDCIYGFWECTSPLDGAW